jgi:hypothetical protein
MAVERAPNGEVIGFNIDPCLSGLAQTVSGVNNLHKRKQAVYTAAIGLTLAPLPP